MLRVLLLALLAPPPPSSAGAAPPEGALPAPAPPDAPVSDAPVADAAPAEEAPADFGVNARVQLLEQHAAADLERVPRELTLSARLQNALAVPVDAVELGVLFAADAERLAEVSAGRVYARGSAEGIGVARRTVPVELPPGGTARVELRFELSAQDPEPTSFLTHLLSYRPLGLTSDGLLELAAGDAADELAAVRLLGLLGGEGAAQDARAAATRDPRWTTTFGGALAEAIPARPSVDETRRRVFAVAALGVLGDAPAQDALAAFGARAELGAFDEPLQVIRTARLLGSPFDGALAFALPPEASRMREVVRWASALPAGQAAHAAAEQTWDTPVLPEAPPPSSSLGFWIAGAVFIVVFAGVWAALRRAERLAHRKARGSVEPQEPR